jgi:hypothetical protein
VHRDYRGTPFPTLRKDRYRAPPVSGIAYVKRFASDHAIKLELGSEAHTLLAFDCNSPAVPAKRPGRVDLFAAPRSCYRCVLALVDAGPQDPYGPPPLDTKLRLVAVALHSYPDAFVYASRVDSIALCQSLEDPSHSDTQRVGGLADESEHRMLLSVGAVDRHQLDEVVHHEMYHLFDFQTAAHDDPEWDALNSAGFVYGKHVASPGFVDDYAQTNAREDKASVFAHMMSAGDAFCQLAARDAIVFAKGRLLRARIAAKVRGDTAFVDKHAPCLR